MKTNEKLQCQTCFAPLDTKASGSNIVRCEYCNTENVLSREVRRVLVEDTHQFRVALYKAIANEFSLEELGDVIMRLAGEIPSNYSSLNDEDIVGKTRSNKSRELIEWCTRRGLLQYLVDVIISVRPNINI